MNLKSIDKICIITARGGSKRIPRKNLKKFLGKPIMGYSIEVALRSGMFDEVMVSTDDSEIAEYALRCGAKVPFKRSSEMSGDFIGTVDVLIEVLEMYREKGMNFSVGCCLYPTAPFVTTKQLKEGYYKLVEKQADTVVPVLPFEYPVQRALEIKNGLLSMVCPQFQTFRSQDLPERYHDAGQFYWFRIESILRKRAFFLGKVVPLILPLGESIDIDTLEDWHMAERLFQCCK